MKRVLCRVTVDPVETRPRGSLPLWKVSATGSGDHEGITAEYQIESKEEGDAAMEGIRRFVLENGGDL